MCVELLLLAANFNFIAFSRYLGRPRRPGVRVLRPHRGGGRVGHRAGHPGGAVPRAAQHQRRRPEYPERLSGMNPTRAARHPAAAAGRGRDRRPGRPADRPRRRAHRDHRRRGGLLRAVVRGAAGRSAATGVPTYDAPVYTWLVSDGVRMQVGFLIDRLTRADDGGGDLRVAVRARLHHRLHARRPGLHALLQLHLAVHLLDADAGDGEQLHAAVLRLGSGRRGLLPADRLLVHAPERDLRQPQGLPRQPHRRLRLRARHRRRASTSPHSLDYREAFAAAPQIAHALVPLSSADQRATR